MLFASLARGEALKLQGMYESRFQPPISRRQFARRLANHFLAVIAVVLISLGIGIVAFMLLEGFRPVDAFLSSAMLLGGLGLVEAPASTAAKLFIGIFALYASLVFVAVFSIVFAPIVHRILHKLNWDGDRSDAG